MVLTMACNGLYFANADHPGIGGRCDFVMFKELITEVASLASNNHRSMRRLIPHLSGLAQHAEDTIHCARRFSALLVNGGNA